MKLPVQSQPVDRRRAATAGQHAGDEIRPQLCYCVNAPGSMMSTWWCEVDRELLDTGIHCTG